MKITKLILHKYTRFSLNNITTITYTPKSKIQLIAGTNGCGKSSLLYELSPLPGNIKQDFLENGFKEIHIEHHNNSYVLRSGVISPLKHNFIMNGEELNVGGTKKVQLVLCKQHFNITPEIHELLIGVRNFTTMSITDRKRWLSDLSTIDYTYPIAVYNKLKSRHRDIVGGLKILDTKISSLETNVLDRATLENYVQEFNHINDFIYKLISKKHNINIEEKNNDMEMLNTLISTTTRYLDKVDKRIDIASKNELELTLNTTEYKIKELLESIETVTELDDGTDANELNNEIQELKTHRDSITVNKEYEISNIDNVLYYFNTNYMTYVGHLNNLSKYSMVNISIDKINKSREVRSSLRLKIDSLEHTLSRLGSEYKMLELNKNKELMECRSCGNSWKVGFDKKRYKEITEEIEVKNKQHKDYVDKLNIEVEYLKEIEECQNTINAFTTFLKSNNTIEILVNDIISKNNLIVNRDTNIIIDKLQELRNDLIKLSDINKTNHKIEVISDKLKMVLMNNDKLRSLNIESKKTLEDRLNSLYIQRSSIKDKIKFIDDQISVIKKIEDNHNAISGLLSKMKTNVKASLNRNDNNYYDNLIGHFKKLSHDLEVQINDARFSNKNIESLKIEYRDLLKTKEALEIGLKTLSPTEGLIAKSILSFLGAFTNNINNIIRRIWTYKMELMPPLLGDDNDLDYKFIINVEDINFIKDISKTSSGMGEVINLANRIVVMHLLDLNDYPLYLDEYGSRFDPKHKDKAHMIAKELSDSYSQVFMISHSQEIYSLYPNSELIIISPDNLFMSDIKDYNLALEIK